MAAVESSSANFYGSVSIPIAVNRRHDWPRRSLPFLGRLSIPITVRVPDEPGMVVFGNNMRRNYEGRDNFVRQTIMNGSTMTITRLWNLLRSHLTGEQSDSIRPIFCSVPDEDVICQLYHDTNMQLGWSNLSNYRMDDTNRRCFIADVVNIVQVDARTAHRIKEICKIVCPGFEPDDNTDPVRNLTAAFRLNGMDDVEASKEVRRISRTLLNNPDLEEIHVAGEAIAIRDITPDESVFDNTRSFRVEIDVRLNITAFRMLTMSHSSESINDWRVDTLIVMNALVMTGFTQDEDEVHNYTCATRAAFAAMRDRMSEERRADYTNFVRWTGYRMTPERMLQSLVTPIHSDSEFYQHRLPVEDHIGVELRPYQRQNVQWMRERESRLFSEDVWIPIEFTQQSVADLTESEMAADGAAGRLLVETVAFSLAHAGRRMYYSPVLNLFTDQLPQCRGRGGILSDEMGLGKTISVLSLISTDSLDEDATADVEEEEGAAEEAGGNGENGENEENVLMMDVEGEEGESVGGTLIVCAVSLIGQWMQEIATKFPRLTAYAHHGPRRKRDIEELKSYDVVITSYHTLQSESKRIETARHRRIETRVPGPVEQVRWHRIVCDESHTLRNGSKQAQLVAGLMGERRWCVTGTPFCIDLDDVFWQMRFLGASYMMSRSGDASRAMWCRMRRSKIKGYDDNEILSAWKLSFLMRSMTIRHHKDQKSVGEPSTSIIEMPNISQTVHTIDLTAAERQAYCEIEERQRVYFRAISRATGMILQVLSSLDPLRQFLSNGVVAAPPPTVLYASGVGRRDVTTADVVQISHEEMSRLLTENKCAICLETFEEPCRTPCNHHFCRECIDSLVNHASPYAGARCPMCRRALTQFSALAVDDDDEDDDDEGNEAQRRQQQERDEEGFSKIRYLQTHLEGILENDPSAKVLVFSQYKTTLSAIEKSLKSVDIRFRTLTGKMSRPQRTRALQDFQSASSGVSVFLLSVRAGAVGINLTAANHVIILEPCINSALEAQAIGRAWRMGQARAVSVHRYIVSESAESRMFARRTRLGDAEMQDAAAAIRGSTRAENRHVSPDYVRYVLRA